MSYQRLTLNTANLSIDWQTGSTKKVVIHHLNGLGLGGTEGMVQILLGWLSKYDKNYDHWLAYKSDGDKTREPYFRDAIGQSRMFCYTSQHQLIEKVKVLKPFVVHRYSAGIPEWPLVPQIKEHSNHFLSTAVFANQDDSIEISRVIYVSQQLKMAAGFGDNPKHVVLRNSIEDPYSNENLREELGIPDDAFVFGRIGRDDENIYDPINLEAYGQVETSRTFFVIVNPSDLCRNDISRFGISNAKFIDKTTSKERLSKFYNTIDVLAHARKDGECNPANVWEAAAHGKPVISHYGQTFNGHIETIADTGFVVLPNDTSEYTRIMKGFIDGSIDYKYYSDRAKQNWHDVCRPEIIGRKYLDILNSL